MILRACLSPFYCYLKRNLFLRNEFYEALEVEIHYSKNTYNPQVIASVCKLESKTQLQAFPSVIVLLCKLFHADLAEDPLTSLSGSAAKSSQIYLYNILKQRVEPKHFTKKEHAPAINT